MPARAAFVKTSLVDFPGRVASVLFLPGCDFRCPYCHNAAIVDGAALAAPGGEAPEDLRPIEEFYEHLDRRAAVLSGAVISGGEPLLRADAPSIAAEIRRRGLAVKLDTNGSFPDRVEAVGADYVALDLKAAPSAYARVAPGLADAADRVLETLRLLRSLSAAGRLEFEIRVTCAPGVVGPEDVEELASVLEREDLVYLQAFRPGGCLDPAWDEVEPHPRPVMEGLLAAVRERAPRARMRGA
jgi:pyruvate formate lyase activating enzyme